MNFYALSKSQLSLGLLCMCFLVGGTKQKIKVALGHGWVHQCFALGLGDIMGIWGYTKNFRARKELREHGPTLCFISEKTGSQGYGSLPKILQ